MTRGEGRGERQPWTHADAGARGLMCPRGVRLSIHVGTTSPRLPTSFHPSLRNVEVAKQPVSVRDEEG